MSSVSLPHRTQRFYRVAASSFFFIHGIVFSSWASRIPDVKTALSLSDAQLGGVLFLIPAGQLSAMMLSGWLVNRFGSRKMLTIASVIYPLALVLLGFVTSKFQLMAALFFFGITSNLSNISVNTQGVGVEKLYNRSIMASFHGMWSLAGVVGGLLGAWMAAHSISTQEHFLMTFFVCLVILLSMYASMLPRDRKIKVGEVRQKTFVKPSLYIALLGIMAFCSMSCEGTMYDWSSVYFMQVVHPADNLIRAGYIACMTAMTIGRFSADFFATRFGSSQVIKGSGVILFIGFVLSVVFPSFYTAVAGFFLVGLGFSSIVPLCYSLAGKTTRMPPSMAVATVSTIGFFGFLFTPPLIGFISQASNMRVAFFIMACAGLSVSFVAAKAKAR